MYPKSYYVDQTLSSEVDTTQNLQTAQAEPMTEAQKRFLWVLITQKFCKNTGQTYDRREGPQYYFEQVLAYSREDLLYTVYWDQLTKDQAIDIIRIIKNGTAAQKYNNFVEKHYGIKPPSNAPKPIKTQTA